MNHYPRHIGDWLTATVHLSIPEECMYSRLLDRYYSREAPLPADVGECCRLARATTPEERSAVESVLIEFFTLESDGWHNKRADEEIAAYRARSAKASDSANARWSERNANAMPTQCDGNANQNQNHNKEPSCVPSSDFESWWKFYPPRRRVDKKGCWKIWQRKALGNSYQAVMSGTRAWRQCKDWTKDGGEFVPAPLVFLRRDQWSDPPVVESRTNTDGSIKVAL